jgi:hypothetical protein
MSFLPNSIDRELQLHLDKKYSHTRQIFIYLFEKQEQIFIEKALPSNPKRKRNFMVEVYLHIIVRLINSGEIA